MLIKYIKTAIGRHKLEIPSGIICAKGNSMVSTLSTITLFNFPTDSSTTVPRGALISRSARASRMFSKILYADAWDRLVEIP